MKRECPKDRDARRRCQAESEKVPEKTEQLAVVAGIAAAADPPLENAAHDAESFGRLLRDDFDFALLPSGEPLLEEDAGRDTIRRCVAESLGVGTSATRWLFYFAGHGTVVDGQGFLVPAGADPENPEELLSLSWLVGRALESGCGEALIVLDACHAGRALLRPDIDPWLSRDATEDLGTVQVLAASGPNQTAVDGYGEGHSVFTECLLEALDGRAGVHDEDDGAVRFTPLYEYVAKEVDRRLEAAGVVHRQQLFGVTVRLGTAGHLRGEFRFRPRLARLSPKLVKETRHENPRVRRESLARLVPACLEPPHAWNLRLARELALTGLPRAPLRETWGTKPSFRELDWETHRQQARTLTALGQLDRSEENFAPISKALLSLALHDRDPDVRHVARNGVSRLLNRVEQLEMGQLMEELSNEPGLSARSLGRHLRHVQATLPDYCRELDPWSRASAVATRTGLAGGAGWRWIFRHRWRRGVAQFVGAAVAMVYLVLGTSYYLGQGPRGEIEVQSGLPGFEALPCIGNTLVSTGRYAQQLKNPALLTEKRLVGSWLVPRDGAFGWGHLLAENLRSEEAALAWWRLGDLDRALEETSGGIAGSNSRCVRAAAYLAFHSDAAFEPALAQIRTALASSASDVRGEAVRALAMLRESRPETTAAAVERLFEGLESLPEGERLVRIEAVPHLATGDAETVATALGAALAWLGKAPRPEVARRLELAVKALLETHPELAAENLDDVLRLVLTRPDEADRTVLLEVAAEAATGTEDRKRTAEALLRLLRRPDAPGRLTALTFLPRLVDGEPGLVAESAPVLAALAKDSDAEVVLAAAAAAELAGNEASRAAFLERLRQIARREGRSALRRRAVERLLALGDEPGAVEILMTATADVSADVRNEAITILVELARDGRLPAARLRLPLGTALNDASPSIRSQAAEGVLLLAESLTDHFEDAFEIAMTELAEPQFAWQAAERWGRAFSRSTPRAAAMFGRQLLLALQAGKGEKYHLFRCFDLLVESQPRSLPELVPTLTRLLADPRSESPAFDLLWRLNTLRREQGVDLSSLNEPFLRQLTSSSERDREAAAYILGTLAGGDAELSGRVLTALDGVLSDPVARVRILTARSLEEMSRAGERSPRLAGLALRGLADSDTAVREAFVETLEVVARRAPAAIPVPFPEALRSMAVGSSAEGRRHAARVLIWRARQPHRRLAEEVPWLRERLAGEEDPVVRLRLAASWAAIDGTDPRPVEELSSLAAASLKGGEEEQQEAIAVLELLATSRLEATRPAVRILRGALPLSENWLNRYIVTTLRDIGMVDSDRGKVAAEALALILREEENDEILYDTVVNGLAPLARFRPELAPEIREELDRFLSSGVARREEPAQPYHPRNRMLRAAWGAWIDLTVEPAAEDLGILWSRLLSPLRPGRDGAFQVLSRLAVDRPDLVPEMREVLGQRRWSVHPHVRTVAAEALEVLEILELTRQRREDPEGFERWQDVLRWLSDLGARTDFDAAVNRGRPRP